MTALLAALVVVLGTTITTTVLYAGTGSTESAPASTLDTIASDAEEA